MTDLARSPLGRAAGAVERYDPALLFAVDRAPLRATIGIGDVLPFHGEDIWTAYELSWLDGDGRPCVGVATLRIPATSPAIVESKSVKLYLTSLNETRFAEGPRAVEQTIGRDIAARTQSQVVVSVAPVSPSTTLRTPAAGICIDDCVIGAAAGAPAPEALTTGAERVSETLYTDLFRSLCPVTAQPDYATAVVSYRGTRIDRSGLLRYLVSFRRHPGFHEHCVETIFADIMRRCAPDHLVVYARFTRRGGIDINPYRSSAPLPSPENVRVPRQ